MNPRIAKEFRVLLLPWSVALAMAIVIPYFVIAVRVNEGGAFLNFILGLLCFALFSSLLAIAAYPLGTEFHHRTLPLLLSQPIPRTVLWKHKLIASSVGISSALLVLVLASFLVDRRTPAATNLDAAQTTPNASTAEWTPPPEMPREQAEMYARRYGIEHLENKSTATPPSTAATSDTRSISEICLTACALLLPTLGSVTFWTLLARSTLGGMVFTAFSQLLVFGILGSIAERFGVFNYQVGILGLSAQTAISALAGIGYGGVFFWLSWRKLTRLEVSQLLPDTLAGSKSLTAQGLSLGWLRCRPGSSFLNLIRKEIQLQKPLFIIAAILCVLWVFSYALLILQPAHSSFPEIVFALTIGFYIPLMSLLSGSISLGEEKNLGITAWHLTFPVSIWRQWAAKLAVGFCTWLFLGLLLPFVLTRLGFVFGGSRIFKEVELESWLGISLFTTGVFVLSFWAMTLFANTVRAVIGTIAAVVALCSSAALAYWLTIELFAHTFVVTLLDDDSPQFVVGWVVLGAVTLLFALVQSMIQFRRAQSLWKTTAKYFCALIAFAFFGTGGCFLFLPLLNRPVAFLLLFVLLLLVLRRMVVAPVARRAGA